MNIYYRRGNTNLYLRKNIKNRLRLTRHEDDVTEHRERKIYLRKSSYASRYE